MMVGSLNPSKENLDFDQVLICSYVQHWSDQSSTCDSEIFFVSLPSICWLCASLIHAMMVGSLNPSKANLDFDQVHICSSVRHWSNQSGTVDSGIFFVSLPSICWLCASLIHAMMVGSLNPSIANLDFDQVLICSCVWHWSDQSGTGDSEIFFVSLPSVCWLCASPIHAMMVGSLNPSKANLAFDQVLICSSVWHWSR